MNILGPQVIHNASPEE